MKNYRSYLNRVTVSDDFHARLLNLEPPKAARRPDWRKYGALAACLALLLGVGAFRVSRLASPWNSLEENFHPDAAIDEIADIAVENPDDGEPGMKTIPGFEVTTGTGPDAVVSYYVLPWIDYGMADGMVEFDYAMPEDCTTRLLSQNDVLALLGGQDVLDVMLDWSGFQLRGQVWHYSDGTICRLDLYGEQQGMHLSLSLSPDEVPFTCCVVRGSKTTTEIWDVEVTGCQLSWDSDELRYELREVSFLANQVGFRFECSGGDGGAVETMVSRFVRQAIQEGFDLSAVTPDGAVPIDVPDPSLSVGKPNWNDGETQAFSPFDSPAAESNLPDAPAADGTASSEQS